MYEFAFLYQRSTLWHNILVSKATIPDHDYVHAAKVSNQFRFLSKSDDLQERQEGESDIIGSIVATASGHIMSKAKGAVRR